MQYIFLGDLDLRDAVYGPFKMTGFQWKIKQDGASSLWTGGRKDKPDGSHISFSVCFDNEAEAHQMLQYLYPYTPDSPAFDEDEGAGIPLYIRTDQWYYDVWAVNIKPAEMGKQPMDYIQYCYEVDCFLQSPYSHARYAQQWTATNQSLNETFTINNRLGHIPSSMESLEVTCLYNAAKVATLALNYGGASQTLATATNYNEVWELIGNENRLLQTYEDTITAGTIWAIDWNGDGTFDTDHIELDNGESAYIRLSGPNPLRYPVTMTADLSLDSGGATGEATVSISPDAITWTEVLDEDDFASGSAEYTLQGSEYLTDCYVKLLCTSGTSGKYLNVGSIKFECERWIEYGAPTVTANATATATLTGTGNVTIDGQFRPRRLFL